MDQMEEGKGKKREVNACLEECTSWKINFYSRYLDENKYLKCGDVVIFFFKFFL